MVGAVEQFLRRKVAIMVEGSVEKGWQSSCVVPCVIVGVVTAAADVDVVFLDASIPW